MTLQHSRPALRFPRVSLDALRPAWAALRNLAPPRVWTGLVLGASTSWLVRARGLQAEACCVALEGTRIRYLGSDAAALQGRVPPGLRLVWPLQGGQVRQRDVAVALVRHLLKPAGLAGRSLMVAVPPSLTGAEQRTLEQVLHTAGVRQVHFVNEALAAAIGAGLNPMAHKASLVVDVGACQTHVAVLALGRTVLARSVPTGGHDLDLALVDMLAQQHRLRIGDATAERVKRLLGSAQDDGSGRTMMVDGISLDSGLPTRVEVSAQDIASALRPVLETLVGSLRTTLEGLTPALLSDVLQPGAAMVLGGGATLPHLADFLSAEMHLRLIRPEGAEGAAALGLASLMRQPAVRRTLLMAAPRTAVAAPVRARSAGHGLAWTLGVLSAVLVWQLTGPLLAHTSPVDRSLTAAITPLWATAAHLMAPAPSTHGVDPGQRRLVVEVQSDRRQLAVLTAQNHHLRGLLHMRGKLAWAEPSVAGEVVARDPAAWLETMVLDVGQSRGVKPGMWAVSDNGLVGEVTDVGPSSARLHTLTFHGATVSGLVARRKAAGVVYGIDGHTCEMRYLDPAACVRIGDVVTTSGQDRCPAGLTVGRVTHLHLAPDGVSMVATVRPTVSLDTVHEILLVGQHK